MRTDAECRDIRINGRLIKPPPRRPYTISCDEFLEVGILLTPYPTAFFSVGLHYAVKSPAFTHTNRSFVERTWLEADFSSPPVNYDK